MWVLGHDLPLTWAVLVPWTFFVPRFFLLPAVIYVPFKFHSKANMPTDTSYFLDIHKCGNPLS